jgi:hypothetical protein
MSSCFFTLRDNPSYCDSRAKRAESARELAAHSHSSGVCAILSPSEYTSFQDTGNCLKSGYYQVRVAASATEPADEFYFNPYGYHRPAGYLGNLWFWSSSVHPDDSDYAYELSGYGGYVTDAHRSSDGEDGAVRCMR